MSESGPVRARVVFRKQVSDGNYGTESAEVGLDVPEYEGMTDMDAMSVALEAARRLVHAELARSPSSSVRRALESPKPITARSNYDDDEDLPL